MPQKTAKIVEYAAPSARGTVYASSFLRSREQATAHHDHGHDRRDEHELRGVIAADEGEGPRLHHREAERDAHERPRALDLLVAERLACRDE